MPSDPGVSICCLQWILYGENSPLLQKLLCNKLLADPAESPQAPEPSLVVAR